MSCSMMTRTFWSDFPIYFKSYLDIDFLKGDESLTSAEMSELRAWKHN